MINGSDANGCLINSESYALTQPDSLTITSISTLSNCNQPTASILATAGGGTVSIDYIYYILNDLGDTISTTSEVNNMLLELILFTLMMIIIAPIFLV